MNRIIYYIFIILMLFSNEIYSQNDTLNFRGKLEKIKIEKLIDKLQLNKNTEDSFIPIYKVFISDMRNLNRSRNRTMRSIEQNLQSEQMLDSLLTNLLKYEQDIMDRKKSFYNEIDDILSTKQIAQLLIFEKNFAGELRKVMRERRRGRN